jgi:hypothetical protein
MTLVEMRLDWDYLEHFVSLKINIWGSEMRESGRKYFWQVENDFWRSKMILASSNDFMRLKMISNDFRG